MEYALSAADIAAAVRGQIPEDVRKYWVLVEGARWPVKQVVALALGADANSFRSSDARRVLQGLGFEVRPNAATYPSIAEQLPADIVEPIVLDRLEVVAAAISFTWIAAGQVTLSPSGIPVFPRLPKKPGLYRFHFANGNEGERVYYIGESKDLQSRARQYKNATVDRARSLTSRRVHQAIVEHLVGGGTLPMAIATEAELGDGSPATLSRKSGRLFGESAAMVRAHLDPRVRLLNLDADTGSAG